MAEWIEMTVGENVGIRLDKYLADQLTDYTRSFIQKQIEQEGVKVNNQIVNSKYKVKEFHYLTGIYTQCNKRYHQTYLPCLESLRRNLFHRSGSELPCPCMLQPP